MNCIPLNERPFVDLIDKEIAKDEEVLQKIYPKLIDLLQGEQKTGNEHSHAFSELFIH